MHQAKHVKSAYARCKQDSIIHLKSNMDQCFHPVTLIFDKTVLAFTVFIIYSSCEHRIGLLPQNVQTFRAPNRERSTTMCSRTKPQDSKPLGTRIETTEQT